MRRSAPPATRRAHPVAVRPVSARIGASGLRHPAAVDLHVHPSFTSELAELHRSAPAEARAVRNAVAILQVEGSTLGFPWSSAVRGGDGLRELRPRRGRSPWRVLYRRSPSGLELLALAPEAGADRRAFDRALARAAARARDRDRGK